MLITKIRSRECREMLTRLGYGRLACACNNRPYIVPIYFVYDADRLYCFSTLGQKIEWMRENSLVCVQADEVRGHDNWASVIVFGQYVEIPNTREYAKSREYVPLAPAKESTVVAERVFCIPDSPQGQAPGPCVLLHPDRGNERSARLA